MQLFYWGAHFNMAKHTLQIFEHKPAGWLLGKELTHLVNKKLQQPQIVAQLGGKADILEEASVRTLGGKWLAEIRQLIEKSQDDAMPATVKYMGLDVQTNAIASVDTGHSVRSMAVRGDVAEQLADAYIQKKINDGHMPSGYLGIHEIVGKVNARLSATTGLDPARRFVSDTAVSAIVNEIGKRIGNSGGKAETKWGEFSEQDFKIVKIKGHDVRAISEDAAQKIADSIYQSRTKHLSPAEPSGGAGFVDRVGNKANSKRGV